MSDQQKVQVENKPTRDDLLQKCNDIAAAKDVLAKLEAELRRCGFVGDISPVLLVYLASFTRFSSRPVSIVVKGGSAAGKSFTVRSALRYVPPTAYVEYSGMSEKALQNSEEDLRHRHLVIGEFAGLQRPNGNVWLRQLLSEHRISYLVSVPKQDGGWTSETRVKEGPTGVIITTTNHALHPEDESRMLSIYLESDPKQTKAVLRAQGAAANDEESSQPIVEPWHAYHDWIDAGPKQVVVPYAEELADLVDAMADRVKRDFPHVIELIKAHALLHQRHRTTDEKGRIVATLEDYRAVHAMVAPWIEMADEATVDPWAPELVDAVVSLTDAQPEYEEGVPQYVVAKKLGVHKGTVSRRVQIAINREWLYNSARPGEPYKLLPGEPLPKQRRVLPTPEDLEDAVQQEVKNQKGTGTSG